MLSKQFECNWPYECMMNLLMSFYVIVALHFRRRCLLFLLSHRLSGRIIGMSLHDWLKSTFYVVFIM